jgi:hypothetical protein
MASRFRAGGETAFAETKPSARPVRAAAAPFVRQSDRNASARTRPKVGGPPMNKLLLSAALALALTPSLAENAVAAKSFQFMFINHTNMQLHFYADEAYACTANAGMVCYSHMAVGPHTVRAAMGSQTLQQFSHALRERPKSSVDRL